MSKLQDTLDRISQLQSTEEQLYKALTQNAQNVASGKENTLSEDEINEMTTQINALSSTRTNLYNVIATMYHEEIKNETTMKTVYDEQIKTLSLLEKELNKSKKILAALKNEKYDQLKMIEINTYYSKKYDDHRRFFRTLTIIGVCMLASLGLKYIPIISFLSSPLMKLIMLIGVIIILRHMLNMYLRSYINYDEYRWPLAPTDAQEVSLADSSVGSVMSVNGIPYLCEGDGCCGEGTVWKDKVGCIVNTPIEGFSF